MKENLTYIALLFCLLYCKQNPPKSLVENSSKNSDYKSYYFTIANKTMRVSEYIKEIQKSDKKIDSITLKNNKLSYYINSDSINVENDFYSLSKTLDFDWTFYLYHDIYSASFMYDEVDSVKIYDSSKKENITFLPCKSDVIYKLDRESFPKSYYIKSFDYNSIDLQCIREEKGKCIVSSEELHNLMSNNKK